MRSSAIWSVLGSVESSEHGLFRVLESVIESVLGSRLGSILGSELGSVQWSAFGRM